MYAKVYTLFKLDFYLPRFTAHEIKYSTIICVFVDKTKEYTSIDIKWVFHIRIFF